MSTCTCTCGYARIRRGVSHTRARREETLKSPTCVRHLIMRSRSEQKVPVRANERANERTEDVRSSVPCPFLLSLFIRRDLRAAPLRLTIHGARSARLPEVRQLVASQFRITALTILARDSKSSDSPSGNCGKSSDGRKRGFLVSERHDSSR